jgi:hypothetical protein
MKWFILSILFLTSCYQVNYPEIQSPDEIPTYKLASSWDPQTTYAMGDLVTVPQYIAGGPIYRSIKDGNQGIQPPTRIVDSIWGEPGEEYKDRPASPNWQDWWILFGIQS